MVTSNPALSRREVLRSGAAASALIVAGSGAAAGEEQVEVNVGYDRESGRQAAKDEADEVPREFNFDALTIRTGEEGAERLRRRDDIRYVEENGTMQAHAQTLPWGVDRVDADVAHDNGETGAGADIAIIDTGIDDDHPDLLANVGEGRAYVDCQGSNCNYPWSDDNDHGTHCAGIADAVDNDVGVVGVSTEATLHAVKVLDKRGSGSYSDVAAGIEYVADKGWDVGSLSLGGSKSDVVEDAVEYASSHGVLLVSSAGNDGPCNDCVSYPAAEPEVVAVSSTDADDSLSSFSSTGPEIELAAPGRDVYSTVIGGYDHKSGTSMACPHVSGAGAQLMANGYTNTEARQQLKDTAEDIGLGDNEQGAGLLDVAEALGLDDGGGGNTSPTVDSQSATEVETDSSDAEFDVDWQVSDDDGDLDTVELTLTDDTDGETEDDTTVDVGGDTASGTTRLVAAGDDGSGNDYTVELVVTDADGASASDTTTVSETEEDGGNGGSAPTIDTFELTDNSNPQWARVEVDWSVSDGDGDLTEVKSEAVFANGATASETSSVGGSSASGTHELRERDGHGDADVTLRVTDAAGNETTDTKTITLG
jgi:subtilisin